MDASKTSNGLVDAIYFGHLVHLALLAPRFRRWHPSAAFCHGGYMFRLLDDFSPLAYKGSSE